MRAYPLSYRIVFVSMIGLTPSPLFGEVPKPKGSPLQQKFGVAALLPESSQSFVEAVREGIEAPRPDFPISRPAPAPPQPTQPDPVSEALKAVEAALKTNQPEAMRREQEIADRKREIQMLELKIARDNALATLNAPKAAPVVRAAPRNASERLLASLGDKPRGAQTAESGIADSGTLEALKRKQQLAYLTNASGGGELQAQLEYHRSARGSAKGRIRRSASREVNLVPPRPAPVIEGSYRHVARGSGGQQGHGINSVDVSAAGLVAGSAPSPVFIEVPRTVRVISDSGAEE